MNVKHLLKAYKLISELWLTDFNPDLEIFVASDAKDCGTGAVVIN